MTAHARARRHVWILAALALLVVGAGIGLRDPWGVDEERFLGVALETLQDGSWLVLHRAAEPYSDKPPLFPWAVALAYRATGSMRVAFRLPGLLAGVAVTLLVYGLGRCLWSRRVGFAAGFLFLATVQSFLVLRAGQTDALLVLWTTLGLYGLLRHLVTGPAWGWYVAGCAAMGLGVATKGVGFLPLLALVPYAYGRWREYHGLAPVAGRDWRWLGGPIALVATVSLWLGPLVVLAVRSGDPALRDYVRGLLVRQTVERMVAAWQHREPLWYFVVEVIPVMWLPVVLGLPWLVPAWRRRLRRGDGRQLLLLGWIALVVLFFSLSTGKRSLYVYPAVPALALAAAPVVVGLAARFGATPGRRRLLAVAVVAWFAGMIGWGLVEPSVVGPSYPRRAIMADVARRIGPDRELGLIQWRDGQWLFARNPIVHWGYREGPEETGQALTWLREAPGRWLLGNDRWLAPCFDMQRALYAGDDRERKLFLVDAGMDLGHCPSEPIREMYRFAWKRPYG